jgi:hypothetical protein
VNPDVAARVRELTERSLSIEEANGYLSTPITDDERRATLELVEWFCRRYPTPLDRLRYVTRAYRRWRQLGR